MVQCPLILLYTRIPTSDAWIRGPLVLRSARMINGCGLDWPRHMVAEQPEQKQVAFRSEQE